MPLVALNLPDTTQVLDPLASRRRGAIVFFSRSPRNGRSFLFPKELSKMTQQQLDRAVAHSLGEDVREISRRGFSVLDPSETYFDPEPDDLPPRTLDWDEYQFGGQSSITGTVDAYLD
jgi:hypothetical protein